MTSHDAAARVRSQRGSGKAFRMSTDSALPLTNEGEHASSLRGAAAVRRRSFVPILRDVSAVSGARPDQVERGHHDASRSKPLRGPRAAEQIEAERAAHAGPTG